MADQTYTVDNGTGTDYEVRVTTDDQQRMAPGAAGTATLSNVNDTASSTTLLASNADRKGFIIANDSTQILYVKFGATASTTSWSYKLAAGDILEQLQSVVYTGVVDGIWAADGSGAARMTELT